MVAFFTKFQILNFPVKNDIINVLEIEDLLLCIHTSFMRLVPRNFHHYCVQPVSNYYFIVIVEGMD